MSFDAVLHYNKEWKPKSSQKPNGNSIGVIGVSKKPTSPSENSIDIESDTAKLQDKLSQVNIFENQNVIIAKHIRVSETDRCQLMFGTIRTEVDSSRHQSNGQSIGTTENSNEQSVARFAFFIFSLFVNFVILICNRGNFWGRAVDFGFMKYETLSFH